MNKIIDNNLKKYRVWKNITQSQLSIELDISLSQLRSIECRSKYPKPKLRTMICKYFDINENQMFYYNIK
jgi:DNA-binding XRE family transcriptional regulator